MVNIFHQKKKKKKKKKEGQWFNLPIIKLIILKSSELQKNGANVACYCVNESSVLYFKGVLNCIGENCFLWIITNPSKHLHVQSQ